MVLAQENVRTLSSSQAVVTTDLNHTDRLLFERLAAIFGVFSVHGEELWGSTFQFDKNPLMLVHRDNEGNFPFAYLLNHPSAASLPNSELVPIDGLPPAYKLTDVPNKVLLNEHIIFDFGMTIGDTPTFIMVYNGAINAGPYLNPGSDVWASFLVHEGFHDQQFSSWKSSFNFIQNAANYPLAANDIASIHLEHLLLIDALNAPNKQMRHEALKRFVAVRSERMKASELVNYMDGPQERYEGTALYLEYRLEEFLPNPKQLSMNERLSHALRPNANRHDLTLARFYVTGAALSYLLDEVGIEWKPLIEMGQSQFKVLDDYFALSDVEKSSSLNETRELYDYPGLQIKAVNTAKAVENDQRTSFNYLDNRGDYIEEIEKPYDLLSESIILDSIPEGYKFLGSFTADKDELGVWLETFSPAGNTVTFMDYGFVDYRLRITKSAFDGKLHEVESLAWNKDANLSKIGNKEVSVASRKKQFWTLTEVKFVHDGYGYVITGLFERDILFEIVKDIIK